MDDSRLFGPEDPKKVVMHVYLFYYQFVNTYDRQITVDDIINNF